MLTVPAPATAYESLILADAPVCYWRFNETNGSIALDAIAGFNGTYGASTTNGVSGVTAPPFYGFESNNLAVAMNHTATNAGAGYVTAPALNLNTNTVTLTAWVYPFTDIALYEGVVFTRASTYSKGLNYVAAAQPPEHDRLHVEPEQHQHLRLGQRLGHAARPVVVRGADHCSNQAIIYVGANGVLRSATNAIAHDVEAWNGGTLARRRHRGSS